MAPSHLHRFRGDVLGKCRIFRCWTTLQQLWNIKKHYVLAKRTPVNCGMSSPPISPRKSPPTTPPSLLLSFSCLKPYTQIPPLKGGIFRCQVVKSIKPQVSSLMMKCILHLRLIAQHPKGRVYKKPSPWRLKSPWNACNLWQTVELYFKPTNVAAGTELSWDPTLPCKSTKVAFHFTSGVHGKIMFHHPKFLKECHVARRCSFLHYLFGGFTRISRWNLPTHQQSSKPPGHTAEPKKRELPVLTILPLMCVFCLGGWVYD